MRDVSVKKSLGDFGRVSESAPALRLFGWEAVLGNIQLGDERRLGRLDGMSYFPVAFCQFFRTLDSSNDLCIVSVGKTGGEKLFSAGSSFTS